MDEASGTREDAHGANDLTDNNTVASATGKINSGADFELSNSEYLSITDASQVGLDFATNFAFSFWLKIETVPGGDGYFYIINKGYEGGTVRQYAVVYERFGGNWLDVNLSSAGSGGAAALHLSWLPVAGTWYHIVISYNASAGTCDCWINGVAQTQGTGGPATIYNGSDPLWIGRGEGVYLDGIIDELSMWSRPLTSGEVAELYNAGAGLAYPFGVVASTGNFFQVL